MVAGAAVVKQVTFFFRFLTEGDGRSGGGRKTNVSVEREGESWDLLVTS